MKRGETVGYGTAPVAMVTFVHTALTNQKPTTTRSSATARSGYVMGVAMLGESPGDGQGHSPLSARLSDDALDQPVHLAQLGEREHVAGLHPLDARVVLQRTLKRVRAARHEVLALAVDQPRHVRR